MGTIERPSLWEYIAGIILLACLVTLHASAALIVWGILYKLQNRDTRK